MEGRTNNNFEEGVSKRLLALCDTPGGGRRCMEAVEGVLYDDDGDLFDNTLAATAVCTFPFVTENHLRIIEKILRESTQNMSLEF